jgi:GNAT superfamily N-acetyltransferase
MRIIELTKQDEPLYFCCLEDWSEEMKDAGDHKERWYAKMKEQGIRIKLAENDEGLTAGMIQYIPASKSFIEAENAFFIMCIWVHGHKQGRGDQRKKGIGRMLLEAAEEDARNLGASGMVAWGLSIPVWMRASWYKKQGYRRVDRVGIRSLMWKPFEEGVNLPSWIKQKKKPHGTNDKVTIHAFINGWCPAQNITYERVKRVSEEFPDKVDFITIDTSQRENFEEWGISDEIFLNGKSLSSGPPLKERKIRKKIGRQVRRIRTVNQ